MSDALHGLMQFVWFDYLPQFVGFEFTVLTDEEGVVGTGTVAMSG